MFSSAMRPATIPFGQKFQDYSGLGETKQRELAAAGEIEDVVAGGRRLIIVESYHQYIERQKNKPQQDARRNRTGIIPALGTKRQKTEANALAK